LYVPRCRQVYFKYLHTTDAASAAAMEVDDSEDEAESDSDEDWANDAEVFNELLMQ
jgi:hypothetical protein